MEYYFKFYYKCYPCQKGKLGKNRKFIYILNKLIHLDESRCNLVGVGWGVCVADSNQRNNLGNGITCT